MKNKKNILSTLIVTWYARNKRELPWRETSDPYLIWISEIILQQTRVAQGYDYYLRFVDRFPDVHSLASADQDEVLKYWQGLGYYSRARNLHSAAKAVVSDFGGKFPRDYKDVLSLKGIGEYTAAAIVSFAYGDPYAVLDGNVFRVLARLFGVDEPIDTTNGKKLFSALAKDLLDIENPGLHNQAMMEFGALQCVPSNPACCLCPLLGRCQAHEKGLVEKLPVKQGKTKTQNRYFNYFDIRCGDKMLLRKRTGNDIWMNLYELPLIETPDEILLDQLMATDEFRNLVPFVDVLSMTNLLVEFKHVLSHRIIYAKFYRIEVKKIQALNSEYVCVAEADRENYAVSRLVEKYFEK
jgi:A/G-specific adenine glycosylase